MLRGEAVGSSNVCLQVTNSARADMLELSRSVMAVNDVAYQQHCPHRCSALTANAVTLGMECAATVFCVAILPNFLHVSCTHNVTPLSGLSMSEQECKLYIYH
jgi:hypothetical protein